ncbi:thioesterase [Staphylococcus saccharolyticus]|uniref:Iron aquisition yersiniabactin synthesis enzyme (YbtT,resembles thioesterases) n=1 Tax=Staphylococcus saccharolyticus TaxID=33028 RepID=A0A380GX85_9STAP|nr:thioesterase [Staphylococcus saccharolyticus]MBL7571218.1 thioesterase [Staphylococcus saccharolyticus]QQB99055.1 thioesterase [Staphylococcus saccharolyticus]QRJ66731.1 thioesterase [Staphylococcus saccharolyticus]RTX99686.1 thioesterase [Staphylococcus saccharolyticus]
MGYLPLNKYLINDKNNCDKSILLFPYAGGGSNIYKDWTSAFQNFDVIRILYPGRESRFSESPVTNLKKLTNDNYEEMLESFNFNNPYYLFGHSMGTKVVYELTLRIQNNNQLPNPKGIIISAGRAPCFMEPKPIYHLDETGFIEGLKGYGGTPVEVLENKELMTLFLPMLRADFIIDEKYQNLNQKQLESPILALMGTKDEQMELYELLEWENYTTKSFKYEYIEGGHMFINNNAEEAIVKIKEFINDLQKVHH